VSPLDDELADELGEGGEDVEHQPPAGGGGVEGLMQGPEADAAFTEAGDARVATATATLPADLGI
jgi:hypothetical protein